MKPGSWLGGLAAACLLASCGDLTDGASNVRGRLFGGSEPWDTSFDFVGGARAHKGLPLRLSIADVECADEGEPRRSIELVLRKAPVSGQRIEIGPEGPEVWVESRAAGFPGWPELSDGESKLADGSFLVRPSAGFFQLDFAGLEPGDGVSGRFELLLATGSEGALEKLDGSFATGVSD